MIKKLAFDVVVQKDESGGHIAFVPSLPGCHTQGETLGELLKNVEEAIELYLGTLEEDEKFEALGSVHTRSSESRSSCLKSGQFHRRNLSRY